MISKETAEHYVWGEICDGWHLVKTGTERYPRADAAGRKRSSTLSLEITAILFRFVGRGDAWN